MINFSIFSPTSASLQIICSAKICKKKIVSKHLSWRIRQIRDDYHSFTYFSDFFIFNLCEIRIKNIYQLVALFLHKFDDNALSWRYWHHGFLVKLSFCLVSSFLYYLSVCPSLIACFIPSRFFPFGTVFRSFSLFLTNTLVIQHSVPKYKHFELFILVLL